MVLVVDDRRRRRGPGRVKRPPVSSTPQVVRDGVLELVGLVEDDQVVLGQHGAAGGEVACRRGGC